MRCLPALAVALGLISMLPVHAATITTIDFTAAEGFVDGALEGQPNNTFRHRSQASYTVDTSGTGTLNGSQTNGFQRFVLDSNLIDLEPLAIGDQVVINVDGYTVNRSNFNGPLSVFGLSFVNAGNPSGGSSVDLAVQFRTDGSDNILLDESGFNDDSSADTGFNVGDTFDFSVTIEKTAADAFQVRGSAGSVVDKITDTNTGVTDFTTGVIYQGQGPPTATGTISFDAISYTLPDTVVVPEPSAGLLLGMTLGLGFTRRRR